jgi:DNA-binding XRE family transcriptional regulator
MAGLPTPSLPLEVGPREALSPPEPPVLMLAGTSYVILTKAEYERLRREAEHGRENASQFAGKAIGPDLRARRLHARLKSSDVARSAGIRVETLSRIENGRTNPTVSTVQAILAVLDRASRLGPIEAPPL